MSNGNSSLKLWQIILGQVPWFITVLALGAWWAAKFDGRLLALEQATKRIEVRQEADQAQKLDEMRREVERIRKLRP